MGLIDESESPIKAIYRQVSPISSFRVADNPLGIHGMIAGFLAVAISELVDTELLDAKLKRRSREAELFRSSGLPSHSSA